MAVPPPSPEVWPLEGLTGINLLEANLTQWASYIQDVASRIRKPHWAAASCPQEDMAGSLHQLEKLINIGFCWHCYGLGNKCRCQRAAPQASQALWSAPKDTYAAMAFITVTTASTSMRGVPAVAETPSGYPALPIPMDNYQPYRPPAHWLMLVWVGGGHCRPCRPQPSHQAQLPQVCIKSGPHQPSSSRPPQ